MALADNLRRIRENRGLYQRQAAELAGIPEGTYVSYERRETEIPPAMYLYKIAKAFETTMEELLDLEPLGGNAATSARAENDRLRARLERYEAFEIARPYMERTHRELARLLDALDEHGEASLVAAELGGRT